MVSLINDKIISPFMDLLKQGISPEMLALSISLGFIVGIIPLIGVSTAICAVLAVVFRLNIVAIQIINYIAYPLQLLFYIPFIKEGETVFGYTNSSFTITEIVRLFEGGFIQAVRTIWLANLQGIIIWMIIAVPVSLLFYYIFLIVLRRFTPSEDSPDSPDSAK